MTASERVREKLTKRKVDKIGASGWYHTPECDRKGPDAFAPVIIDIRDHSDWDFLKVMATGIYMQEAYGSDIEFFSENIPPERLKNKMIFEFKSYLVNSAKDMMNFPILDVRNNEVFKREASHIKVLKDHYGDTVPILPTIFLPCHTIPEFCGGIPKAQEYFREYPEAVDHMVKTLYETEKELLDMYIEAGADGFFFATRWGCKDMITREQFERFCYPYETDLINRVQNRTWFNMIHTHGSKGIYWDYFNDYAVQAYNWENVPQQVPEAERETVAKVRSLTNKILVTGTDQFHDFYGTKDEVLDRFRERLAVAAKESEDNRLIFAAGCSLPLDIERENVHQLRVAVDEYNNR